MSPEKMLSLFLTKCRLYASFLVKAAFKFSAWMSAGRQAGWKTFPSAVLGEKAKVEGASLCCISRLRKGGQLVLPSYKYQKQRWQLHTSSVEGHRPRVGDLYAFRISFPPWVV